MNKKTSLISKPSSLLCAVALITVSLLPSANADTNIPVTNGSFEESTGYTGSGTPTGVPGWTEGASYGQAENVVSKFTSGLTGVQATWVGNQFYNPTSLTFVSGETYTISLDLGQPLTATEGKIPYGFSYGFENAGNTAFVASTYIDSPIGAAIPKGTFQTFSFSYTAQPADEGQIIKLGIDSYFGGNDSLYIDNVTASTTLTSVPEPSTYLYYLVSGVAGLVILKRHRQGKVSGTR